MSCECKKKCDKTCVCAVNYLKCTDMCSCKNCDNTTLIEGLYNDDDGDESDEYSDDESDSEN